MLVNITEFVTVNFDSLVHAIDAIGGVTITVTSEEINYIISTIKKKPNTIKNINFTPKLMMELIEKDESLSFEILSVVCKMYLNE